MVAAPGNAVDGAEGVDGVVGPVEMGWLGGFVSEVGVLSVEGVGGDEGVDSLDGSAVPACPTFAVAFGASGVGVDSTVEICSWSLAASGVENGHAEIGNKMPSKNKNCACFCSM